MNRNLFKNIKIFRDKTKKPFREYSGILGLPINTKTVRVPGREGYVYVRLRDNQNEIIQAYNDKVSAIWGLPVLLVRDEVGWKVKGRDIDRYSHWTSDSSFVPGHHLQHEFNRDFPGADIINVYPDQIVPLLVYPSENGNTLRIAPYVYKSETGWIYAGGVETSDLLVYKPTSVNDAIVGLIYMNKSDGSIGVSVNPNPIPSYLSSITDILPYIPFPSSSQEPLKAFRLLSTTTKINWENLYDVRQFIGGSSGSLPTLSNNKVVITDTNGNLSTDTSLLWNSTQDVLSVGNAADAVPIIGVSDANNLIAIAADQSSSSLNLFSWGTNVAGYVTGWRANGTKTSPSAVNSGDVLLRLRARGHNGTDWTESKAVINMKASENWMSTGNGTSLDVQLTPNGTTSPQTVMSLNGNGDLSVLRNVFYNNGELLVPPLFSNYLPTFSTAYRTPYLISGGNFTTLTLTSNTIYWIPFYVPKTILINTIAMKVSTASTGNHILGIYNNDNNGYPDNLLSSSALSVASTGAKSATISVQLTPGMYWFAWASTSSPTVVAISSSSCQSLANSAFTNNFSMFTSTGNSLPSTAPKTGYSGVSSDVPAIGIKW
jgi:hypothetical protein